MSDNIVTICTNGGDEVKTSNQLVVSVGGVDIGGITEIDIHKIGVNGVLYVTIKLAVRLGNES